MLRLDGQAVVVPSIRRYQIELAHRAARFVLCCVMTVDRVWPIGPEVKWSPTAGARGRQRSPARQEQAVQG